MVNIDQEHWELPARMSHILLACMLQQDSSTLLPASGHRAPQKAVGHQPQWLTHLLLTGWEQSSWLLPVPAGTSHTPWILLLSGRWNHCLGPGTRCFSSTRSPWVTGSLFLSGLLKLNYVPSTTRQALLVCLSICLFASCLACFSACIATPFYMQYWGVSFKPFTPGACRVQCLLSMVESMTSLRTVRPGSRVLFGSPCKKCSFTMRFPRNQFNSLLREQLFKHLNQHKAAVSHANNN